MYAQPLYVEKMHTGDGVVRDLVLVATANNSVYAFDVHSFWCVWRCHLGEPDRSDQLPPFKGHYCGALSPGRLLARGREVSFAPVGTELEVDFFIGIQATPVIDRRQELVYVSYRVGGPTFTRAQQRLAAVHLESGAVAHDVPIAQHRDFRIESQRQRAGLLLLDGMLFVAFASRCEDPGVVANTTAGSSCTTPRPSPSSPSST